VLKLHSSRGFAGRRKGNYNVKYLTELAPLQGRCQPLTTAASMAKVVADRGAVNPINIAPILFVPYSQQKGSKYN